MMDVQVNHFSQLLDLLEQEHGRLDPPDVADVQRRMGAIARLLSGAKTNAPPPGLRAALTRVLEALAELAEGGRDGAAKQRKSVAADTLFQGGQSQLAVLQDGLRQMRASSECTAGESAAALLESRRRAPGAYPFHAPLFSSYDKQLHLFIVHAAESLTALETEVMSYAQDAAAQGVPGVTVAELTPQAVEAIRELRSRVVQSLAWRVERDLKGLGSPLAAFAVQPFNCSTSTVELSTVPSVKFAARIIEVFRRDVPALMATGFTPSDAFWKAKENQTFTLKVDDLCYSADVRYKEMCTSVRTLIEHYESAMSVPMKASAKKATAYAAVYDFHALLHAEGTAGKPVDINMDALQAAVVQQLSADISRMRVEAYASLLQPAPITAQSLRILFDDAGGGAVPAEDLEARMRHMTARSKALQSRFKCAPVKAVARLIEDQRRGALEPNCVPVLQAVTDPVVARTKPKAKLENSRSGSSAAPALPAAATPANLPSRFAESAPRADAKAPARAGGAAPATAVSKAVPPPSAAEASKKPVVAAAVVAAAAHAPVVASDRAPLHVEYPFLAREPCAGVFLEDLDLVGNPRFQAACNRLCMKRTNATTAAGKRELVAQEQAVNEVAVSFAQELRERTIEAYASMPYLGLRVDGVLLGALVERLDENEEFQSLKSIRRQVMRGANGLTTTSSQHRLRSTEKCLWEEARVMASTMKRFVSEDKVAASVAALTKMLPRSVVDAGAAAVVLRETPATPVVPEKKPPAPPVAAKAAEKISKPPTPRQPSAEVPAPVPRPPIAAAAKTPRPPLAGPPRPTAVDTSSSNASRKPAGVMPDPPPAPPSRPSPAAAAPRAAAPNPTAIRATAHRDATQFSAAAAPTTLPVRPAAAREEPTSSMDAGVSTAATPCTAAPASAWPDSRRRPSVEKPAARGAVVPPLPRRPSGERKVAPLGSTPKQTAESTTTTTRARPDAPPKLTPRTSMEDGGIRRHATSTAAVPADTSPSRKQSSAAAATLVWAQRKSSASTTPRDPKTSAEAVARVIALSYISPTPRTPVVDRGEGTSMTSSMQLTDLSASATPSHRPAAAAAERTRSGAESQPLPGRATDAPETASTFRISNPPTYASYYHRVANATPTNQRGAAEETSQHDRIIQAVVASDTPSSRSTSPRPFVYSSTAQTPTPPCAESEQLTSKQLEVNRLQGEKEQRLREWTRQLAARRSKQQIMQHRLSEQPPVSRSYDRDGDAELLSEKQKSASYNGFSRQHTILPAVSASLVVGHGKATCEVVSTRQAYRPTSCQLPASGGGGGTHPIVSLSVTHTRFVHKELPLSMDDPSDTLRSRGESLSSRGAYEAMLQSQAEQHGMLVKNVDRTEYLKTCNSGREAPAVTPPVSPYSIQRRTSGPSVASATGAPLFKRTRPHIQFDTTMSLNQVYQRACQELGMRPNSGLLRTFPTRAGECMTKLDLSVNYVGIRGLQPIFYVLESNGGRLDTLILSNNNIENLEVLELVEVLASPAGASLVTLDLSYNPISQGGGKALLQLCQLRPSLSVVKLKGTLIPPKLMQSIQDKVEDNGYRKHIGIT